MPNSSRRSLGALIGEPFRQVNPDFDMAVWRAKRRSRIRSGKRSLVDLKPHLEFPRRESHLVVAPHPGTDSKTWRIAGQNHFFEIFQSATEILGPHRVTLLDVAQDESQASWHRRLLEVVIEKRATHIICQIENDPNQGHSWSWDVLGSLLGKHWGGSLIGIMYDSAFPWLRMKAQHLGHIMPNLLVAELCEPMTGQIKPGRVEVGPMTMPLSKATVTAIDDYVRGLPKLYDLSFIGALYDYRVELIEELRAAGVNVAVNPHRPDVTSNYHESRTNQPTYLEYMKGLAQSEMTLNFSLASGGPVEQYKIRVQEASMVGCLCLTDDQKRTKNFFAQGEYEYFGSLDAIPKIVSDRLADPVQLRADQESARARAHELAHDDFWGRIEDGLLARGMQPLTGIRPPIEP